MIWLKSIDEYKAQFISELFSKILTTNFFKNNNKFE